MNIKINNKKIECEEGKTILQVCKDNGINIPTLCYQENLEPEARCRLCIVETKDGKLITSCSSYPKEGMEIKTNSEKVKRARKVNAELLMPEHMDKCFRENKNHDLCRLIHELGIREVRFDPKKKYKVDLGASVIRDDNLCINCGRCVAVCDKIQSTWAIDFAQRAHHEHVTPYSEKNLNDVACIKCGQCIAACPVGAISEREHLQEVLKVLKDKKKHVVVQTAPSIRASLGEEFDLPPGTLVTGKMVAALRRCGFDKVFDTNFGADLTIMEEGSELLKRIKENKGFPMITTCCPAWIKFMEHFYHDLIKNKNMSSCKSPHEMLGSLIKTYYAKKANIPKEDIIVVSIMPCTAKKFESTRPELKSGVDYVLTTRETARLIEHFNIDFKNLSDEDFDPVLGMSTGAAAIFGATGGVMEAALRTAYELATGKELKSVDFKETRGLDGIKTGKVDLDGKKIRFAVANGLKNARELLKEKDKFDFIEIMACPGGCISGGGQPLPYEKEKIKKRIEAIYEEDKRLPLRKSHENPMIKQIYEEFLGKPLSKKSEKLLHTRYFKRSPF
ncbi:4Fe-4S dicluster domain-containing protein [Candidatus Woesearchaeota archaeon]|nr:4Fe-4S dicluster domain-containing protein [Candidatus Woesearchaeota archaeon]